MAVLSFRFASSEMRGNHESGVDYATGQSRDRKIESGIASTWRWGETEGDQAGEGTRIQAQNISGWQKKNCGSTTGEVGEDQGGEEVEGFQSASTLSLRRRPAS